MRTHDVIVAGAGPTGMMVAAELALAGVDVAVVARFLAEWEKAQVAGFSFIPLPIEDFPTRHNYGLALLQTKFERILATWIAELPVTFVLYTGPWELPAVAAVSAPSAVLVRPDGYVAWGGEGGDAGLRESLTRWFGAPAAR